MRLKSTFIDSWYAMRWWNYCLLPFSLIFFFVTTIKRCLYRYQWLKSYRSPVPIIIVGNISVGGTGKTPVVIALAKFLQEAGYHPGIVSRGYGARHHKAQLLTPSSAVTNVGDEPLLIYQRTACPVAIGAKRPEVVKALLTWHPECNVILSDDGLQHYALARDIEIAVIDTKQGLGNACLLPAGPLRESPLRLKSVDIVIENGDPKGMHLEINAMYSLLRGSEVTQSFDELEGHKVHALAGIGNPGRFFQTLRSQGLQVIEHSYPDHYQFHPKDIHFDDSLPILMTEKDAVKCADFATERHWVVPATANINPDICQEILRKLNALSSHS